MGVSNSNKTFDSEPIINSVNLRKLVKSNYIIEIIFSFLREKKKLEIINYNNKFQKFFKINIEDYKEISEKYLIIDKRGNGKIYKLGTNILIYEGKFLNDKKNGKGKEYYENKKLKSEGEYLNGKILKVKSFDEEGKIMFKIDSNGKGKEYYNNGKLKFEGNFRDGKKMGR